MPEKPPVGLTVAEFDAILQTEIEIVQCRMDVYDERAAIQEAERDDGKTTDMRAYEALQRPERFAGEHATATAWLKEHAHSIWSAK